MKILRILLIILVPAMGIVSCRKADVKPATHDSNCSSQTTTNSSSNVAGREAIVDQEQPAGQPTDIYGSGDDDRNGGEKRKKKD